MNKIIPHLTAEHFGSTCAFWNSHEDWFLQRDQIKVHRYQGSLHLWDITDAMKPGKVCTEFTLRWDHFENQPAGLYRLFERHSGPSGTDLRAVFNELLALPWEQRQFWANGTRIDPPGSAGWQEMADAILRTHLPGFDDHHIEIYRQERPAIRTWSPFAEIKPLKETPKKWTVAHVVRALLSGQFSHLQCHGVYTDDYAYDNAVNYHIGEFGADPSAAVAFARRILESPSGWWASERGEPAGTVSICCHSFDSNSFKFELMKRFNPAACGSATLAATPLPDGDIAIHATITRTTEADEPETSRKGAKAQKARKKLGGLAALREPVSEITLTVNEERDLVELRFPGKPSDDVRAEMKAAKFRWYGPAGCWYHKHTPENLTWAQAFVARQRGAGVPPAGSPVVPTESPVAVTQSPIATVTPEIAAAFGMETLPNVRIVPAFEPTPVVFKPEIAPAAATPLPAWRQRFAR